MKTLIHQVGHWLHRRMRGLTDQCSHWLNRLPRRRQQQAVIIFLVCCAAYALLGICGMMHPGALEATPITAPKPAGQAAVRAARPAATPLAKAIRDISAFRRYVDSLRTDTKGLKMLDSLHAARPGLFDTVDQLERIYQLK